MLFRFLGTAAYIVPFGVAMWAWRCFAAHGTRVAIPAVVGWVGMVIFAATLFSIGLRGVPTIHDSGIHTVMEVDAGGMVGDFVADILNAYFASVGRSIIVISGLLLSVLAALPISLGSIGRRTVAGLGWMTHTLKRRVRLVAH